MTALPPLALAALLAAAPGATNITGDDLARLQLVYPPGDAWNVANALVREVRSLRLDRGREVVLVYATDPAPDYDQHFTVRLALLDTAAVPNRRRWVTNLHGGAMLPGTRYQHALALRTDLPGSSDLVELTATVQEGEGFRVLHSIMRLGDDPKNPFDTLFSSMEWGDPGRGERPGLASSVRAKGSPDGVPTELIAVTGLRDGAAGRLFDGGQERRLLRVEDPRRPRFKAAGPAATWIITASSTLAPAGGEDYEPMRAVDGDPATAWCKAAARPAEGEWMALRLSEAVAVSAVIVTPGVARSEALFLANGRPARLRISWPGGALEATLEDSQAPQRIALPQGTRLQQLRLELLEVRPGAKYRDACLSEIDLEFGR